MRRQCSAFDQKMFRENAANRGGVEVLHKPVPLMKRKYWNMNTSKYLWFNISVCSRHTPLLKHIPVIFHSVTSLNTALFWLFVHTLLEPLTTLPLYLPVHLAALLLLRYDSRKPPVGRGPAALTFNTHQVLGTPQLRLKAWVAEREAGARGRKSHRCFMSRRFFSAGVRELCSIRCWATAHQ